MRGRGPALLLVGLFSTAVLALAEDEPLRIGTITVRSLDVFAPEEAERGWVYRAADLLHVTTRPETIRKFLLFGEGDPYDPALLEQTERNLRDLAFIKSARVRASEAQDGVVDVEVVTQDAWTTEIAVNLGSSGGETRWATGLTERNFLGLGKEVGVSYGEGVERTDRRIEFRDPALFGSYWSAAFVYADNSDGGQKRIRILKPFASSLDRLSADALWDDHSFQERVYAGGEITSEFSERHEAIRVFGGTPLEAGSLRARRLLVGIHFFRDTFRALPSRPEDPLPEDRDFRYLALAFEDVASDYVALPYVNRDLRIEDFNLGMRLAVSVALSPAAFGAPRTTGAVAASAERGWRLPGAAFARGRLAFETRLSGGLQNAILSATGLLVVPHASALRQTTVAQVQYQQGWNLDRDVQFFADGDHGLRGYRLYSFEGDRRLVVNVEHRLFGGFEVLQLFTLGAAVFVDTGTAVPAGTPLRFASLKTDAGVGLRIGIARASRNPILRLDCAYAFDAGPQGKRGWLVSFSSGQAF